MIKLYAYIGLLICTITLSFSNTLFSFHQQKNVFNIDSFTRELNKVISKISTTDFNLQTTCEELNEGDLIFRSLKNTTCYNLIDTNVMYCKKYNYSFNGINVYFVTIDYMDSISAQQNFQKIMNIAKIKKGIPGLTYENDFITEFENTIFWINSSCSMSFQNHEALIDILIDQIGKTDFHIYCKCGKVRCTSY